MKDLIPVFHSLHVQKVKEQILITTVIVHLTAEHRALMILELRQSVSCATNSPFKRSGTQPAKCAGIVSVILLISGSMLASGVG